MSNDKKTPSVFFRYIYLIFVVAFGLMTIIGSGAGKSGGGSSDSGGTTTTETAPTISDLSYTPTEYYIGTSSSTATITGTATFSDTEGDVSTVVIALYNSSETLVDTIEQDADTGTSTSGTVSFSFDIDTSISAYTFKVYLVDSTDLESSTLSGSLTGEEAVAPLIGDLSYTPSEVVINDGGGAIQVTGTLSWADQNADISTIHIIVYDSDGNAVTYGNNAYIEEDAGLSDSTATSGTDLAFTFYVYSPTDESDYTFEIYVIDSTGLVSNSLYGDETSTGTQVSTPVIGNLGLSNSSGTHDEAAETGEVGGSVSFLGSIDFLATQGNVSNVVVEVFPSIDSPDDITDLLDYLIDYTASNEPISSITTSAGVYGETSSYSDGSDAYPIDFEFYISTLALAYYPIRVHVVDTDGNISNYVYETINIGSSSPTIGSLSMTSSTTKLDTTATSLAVTADISFAFADEDGNLDSVIIKVYNSSGTLISTDSQDMGLDPDDDVEYDEYSTSFQFTVTSTGTYTVNIYVKDDIKMTSNVLSGTITITN